MPCFHPLKGFPYGKTENGKVNYLIRPFETEFILDGKREPIFDYTLIPCGQCIGCRLERSRQWANRCLLELEYHESAYFLTLTYNPEHVPTVYYSDENTGEAYEALSLRKRHFQLFMKRLRKAFPDQKLRFFACGEYGGKTQRPHYHAIIFGLKLPDGDLKPYGRNRLNDPYFTSEKVQRAWSIYHPPDNLHPDGWYDPIGFALVANVTWETCAYVARYVTKKLSGKAADFYKMHNIEPEFSLMSRKPGIGRQYYDDHPDAMDFEYINISTPKGGRKFTPPKYFDRLYEVDDPDEAAERKERRKKFAEDLTAMKLAETNLSLMEYLEVEEDQLKDKFKKLRRRYENA